MEIMKSIINTLKTNYIDKYIGDSQYKKHVIVMVVGRVIAQALPILITPLLTRIYSPEEFGIFAIYSSVVSLIAMLSNGRYCLSIILPKDREMAKYLVILSSFLTIFATVIFYIITLIFGVRIFEALNAKAINDYIFLLALNILIVGLYEAIYFYALREKEFRLLSSSVIVQAIVLVLVRIITGLLGYTDIGLVISYILGFLVAYIQLVVKLKLRIDFKLFKSNIKGLILKYINFPKFSLFSDTLGNLSNSLPNIFLNKFFGSGEVGYLSLSDKILGTPIWFITSSVGDVFKQEASELYRNGKSCKTLFIKTSKTLFYVGIIPFLLIFLFVPPLVPFVFGDIWAPAGAYIRIFSIMFFTTFVITPTAHMPYIVNKQQYAALFQGSRIVSIFVAFIVGFLSKNLILALILWSFLITLTNVLIFLISYKFSKMIKTQESTQNNEIGENSNIM